MKYKCFIITFYIFFSISIFGQPKSIINQFDKRSQLYADKVLSIEDVFIKFPSIYYLPDTTLIITAPLIGFSTRNSLIYKISKRTGRIIKEIGIGELAGVNSVSYFDEEIIFYMQLVEKFFFMII